MNRVEIVNKTSRYIIGANHIQYIYILVSKKAIADLSITRRRDTWDIIMLC